MYVLFPLERPNPSHRCFTHRLLGALTYAVSIVFSIGQVSYAIRYTLLFFEEARTDLVVADVGIEPTSIGLWGRQDALPPTRDKIQQDTYVLITNQYHKKIAVCVLKERKITTMVSKKGLEPSRPKARAPKTLVAAISPLRDKLAYALSMMRLTKQVAQSPLQTIGRKKIRY